MTGREPHAEPPFGARHALLDGRRPPTSDGWGALLDWIDDVRSCGELDPYPDFAGLVRQSREFSR